MDGFSYYMEALVEKKKLLSDFGGDSGMNFSMCVLNERLVFYSSPLRAVRGITARQRNEDTAKRVGLKMPEYAVEDLDVHKYAEQLGLGTKPTPSEGPNASCKQKNSSMFKEISP